jgi:hypothetical protein
LSLLRYIDESRIDAMEYVAERIREADWDKESEVALFD